MGKKKIHSNKLNLFQVSSLIFLILILIGKYNPAYYNWGFNHFSYHPNFIFNVCISVASIFIFLSFFNSTQKVFDSIIYKTFNFLKTSNRYISYTIISISLIFIFYILRSNIHLYGDGYSMIEILSKDDYFDLFGQEKYQALSIIFYRSVVKIAVSLFETNPQNVIVWVNIIFGLSTFWAAQKIGLYYSKNNDDKITFIIGVLTASSIMLFFGYIENYIITLSFSLWAFII